MRPLDLVVAASLGVPAFAQIASVTPAEPRRGDELKIAYDTAAGGARLRAGHRLRVLFEVRLADGRDRRIDADLVADGSAYRTRWTPPEDAVGVTMHFIAADAERPYDQGADRAVVIRRADGSLPRGAGAVLLADAENWADVDRTVTAELERFPDSFAICRDKWFRAKWPGFGPPDHEAMVDREIAAVAAWVTAHAPTAEALYALASGHLQRDRLDTALPLLQQLVDGFAPSAWTGRALSLLDYTVYTMPPGAPKTETEAKSRRLLLALAQRNPRDDHVREKTYAVLAGDAQVPLELVDRVATAWLDDCPEQPFALEAMARARSVRGTQLDAAAEFARRETNAVFAGRLRTFDVANQLESMVLVAAFQLQAEIALQRGQLADAAAAAVAAQAAGKRTDATPFLLEAKAWETAGDARRAERAFARAWELGDTAADAALRRIHRARTGSDDGFAAHLADLVATAGGQRPAAPQFTARLLDGSELRNADLAGKVVVLNFWHTGCAPCVAEMPALNRLVRAFADKDVVFLGVTFEPADRTRTFLGTHEFSYRPVVDGQAVAKAFGVAVYPTHAIVDRQGRIALSRIGGADNIDEVLRPIVEAALR